MAGIRSLRKLTLGRESVAGTPVNATTYWRGVGTIEDTRVVTFPEEDVGYISGLDRSYQPALGALLAMESTPATFEQVLHILEAGVKLVGTEPRMAEPEHRGRSTPTPSRRLRRIPPRPTPSMAETINTPTGWSMPSSKTSN